MLISSDALRLLGCAHESRYRFMRSPLETSRSVPKAKSQELRNRVIVMRHDGLPAKQIPGVLVVSKAWVRPVMHVMWETGCTKPLQQNGVHGGVWAVDKALRRLGFCFKKNDGLRGHASSAQRRRATRAAAASRRPETRFLHEV